ncbi:hypothetical protein BD626DRAFT_495803 [Schizophyllum amplum]|uniref:Uncharacterized protein n=1 Tax=Schizophyllum amplum TaxID=97359 RepID=A0A550CEG2_9AGAR|nr:hypothetical protein BD626DRAFT_495803 [Auriculariopsis ampla]
MSTSLRARAYKLGASHGSGSLYSVWLTPTHQGENSEGDARDLRSTALKALRSQDRALMGVNADTSARSSLRSRDIPALWHI